ncbi:MAG: crossover junction endodeoxyribonuclease RuvC [Bacteroidetes bacterium]|nr:crossover junction endodeoxyribonuclease RuvC [Bacteroidota bacterium]
MLNPSRIILGVDPGTVVMGYALLEVGTSGMCMRSMDVYRLDTRVEMFERLRSIQALIHQLIVDYDPMELAIEAPFFGKNVQSMLKLGRSQGVVIGAALAKGLSVSEYSPRSIKQSITGNGNASKERVWYMLQHTLGFRAELPRLDASDALAVAVCHHYAKSAPVMKRTKKAGVKGGWEAFIRQNPGRLG